MIFSKRISTSASFLFGCVIFAFSSFADAQMQIDSFSAAANDRFFEDRSANDLPFIGDGFDFSGVGRGNSWGTLISPNVIITAFHARASGTIRFYETNDPNGPFVEREVLLNGERIDGNGTTDLYVARLDSPVPSTYQIYDFATEGIVGNAAGDTLAGTFQGSDAFMVGRSPTAQASVIDVAIGENVISGYRENLVFGTNTDNDAIILAYDQPGSLTYQTYESHVRGGDSSAPLFIDDGTGNLLLLGVNTARLQIRDTGEVVGSAISYTGNVADEINAFIAVSAVPEPTSFAVLLGVTCLMSVRRKKTV